MSAVSAIDLPPSHRGNRSVIFDSFIAESVDVLNLAGREARRLRTDLIDTEHLLLALIGKSNCIASKALSLCGVDLREARIEVEKIVGFGDVELLSQPLNHSTEAALAMRESLSMQRTCGDSIWSTELLLIALINRPHSVAARVLSALKVVPEELRRIIAVSRADRAVREAEAKESPHQAFERWLASSVGASTNSVLFAVECPDCAEIVMRSAASCYWCGLGISDEHYKTCRFCCERIRKDAARCLFCRSDCA